MCKHCKNIKKDIPSWDKTFMDISKVIAKRSKDPRTKVGAVIVKDNIIIGCGYNGFPRGCNDEDLPWESNDDLYNSKHAYVVHAEQNAILNSSVSCKGATLYVSLFPCNECAKVIIQSGISKIIYEDEWDSNKPTVKASKRMFELAGVKYEILKEK